MQMLQETLPSAPALAVVAVVDKISCRDIDAERARRASDPGVGSLFPKETHQGI